MTMYAFFFSSRRRHTRCLSDWSSDVCSSDLFASFALDHPQGLVKVEPVRLHVARRAHLPQVAEVLDAGAGLEPAGAEEGAVGRIEAERPVAAAAQRLRQATLDAPGRDARDVEHETPVGARRKTGQHVVLGVPARPAGRLDEQGSRLA